MNNQIAQQVDEHIDKLNEEIKDLLNRIDTFQKALFIAGQYARDWLPAEVPKEHYDDYLKIICGGNERDPEGREFVAYWLSLANK